MRFEIEKNDDGSYTVPSCFNEVDYNTYLRLLFSKIIKETLNLNFNNLDSNIKANLFSNNINTVDNYSVGIDNLIVNSVLTEVSHYIVVTNLNIPKDGSKDFIDLDKPIKGNFAGLITINNNYLSKDIYKTRLITVKGLSNLAYLKKFIALNFLSLNGLEFSIKASNLGQLILDPKVNANGNSTSVEKKTKEVLREIFSAFRKTANSFFTVQGGNGLNFPSIDFTKYEQIQLIIYQELSNITGFPITYLLGRSPAGMNSTGDLDAKATTKAVKLWALSYTLPFLQSIQNALNGGKIDIIDDDVILQNKIKNIQDILPIIDGYFSDDDNTRNNILNILLGKQLYEAIYKK